MKAVIQRGIQDAILALGTNTSCVFSINNVSEIELASDEVVDGNFLGLWRETPWEKSTVGSICIALPTRSHAASIIRFSSVDEIRTGEGEAASAY